MKTYHQFYINGQWVSPNKEQLIEVINPATDEVAGTVAMGNAADVDSAVAAAKTAFESFSQTTVAERIELLQRIAAVYETRMDDMAAAITAEMGAPLETLAKTMQAPAGMWHIMTTAGALSALEFEEKQGTTQIVKEAIGVCGLITPWNWPINQIACKVAPAIAAGCTMVLKPSEIAPFSAYVFAEILHEAGVPAGVFNLVGGDGLSVGAPLSAHRDVDLVSFTGSTRAGVLVSQAAAPTVKRVALELGGKSANIILDDADFEQAVAHGVMALMGNTGQSCNAPSRMLVPASRMAEVEAIAKAVVDSIVVGDPLDATTTMGPLSSKAHFDKVQSLIQQGIDEGAHLLCGGVGRPDGIEKGCFTKPTIFSRVNNQMTVAVEEIFGPVLCILPYEDENEAVSIANDSIYGLSGYVSSASLERAQSVAKRLRTGNVHLNGAGPDLAAPFGGYKQSGLGREWGAHGIAEFLEVKAIIGYHPSE